MMKIEREENWVNPLTTVKENISHIYKEHNGLVLEEELQKITGDKTFKFQKQEEIEKSGYTFKNENGEKLILNDDGDLIYSDIGENYVFCNMAKKRISKTKQALKMMN